MYNHTIAQLYVRKQQNSLTLEETILRKQEITTTYYIIMIGT